LKLTFDKLLSSFALYFNLRRYTGDTPLSIAIDHGHVDVARKLRAAGANIPRRR
jgi:ankyrin repeat protein